MNRKLRIVKISGRVLMEILKGEHHYKVTGLPEDAYFVGWREDFNVPDIVSMVVHSETFSEVEEGMMIPPLYGELKITTLPCVPAKE